MRVRKYKSKGVQSGVIVVEKNDAEHDHTADDQEERSYNVYEKKILECTGFINRE